MAARPKLESRPPKSFIDKVEQPKPCAKKKKTEKDNNLYDIDVTFPASRGSFPGVR